MVVIYFEETYGRVEECGCTFAELIFNKGMYRRKMITEQDFYLHLNLMIITAPLGQTQKFYDRPQILLS